ncbi:MAG TPA: hypothetical protein VES94_06190, partial [Burkholderiales bacterium]|nr:hypothetical protein [Burkholderiales bacterium]
MSEELDKVPIRQEIAGEIYAVIDAHARANGIKATTAIEGILRRWAIKELHRMRLAEIFLRRKGTDRQRPADGGSSRQQAASTGSYRQATDNAWDQALRALAGKGNYGADTD